MVEQSFLPDPFTAARATPNMVGRREEVAQIKAIVDAAVDNGILVHIIGAGGIGKTRLLGSLLAEFQETTDYLVAAELVDLYHAESNTVEGLVAEIHRVLHDAGVACPLYEAEIAKLQELQGNRPHATQEISDTRENAIRSLVQDLKDQRRRVVIALDTAEKLDLQRNPIPEQLGLSERRANTIAWIVEMVKQLDNVAVLLAGRPSVYGVADDLKSELEKRYELVNLPGLREDEALAYFDAVLKALAESSAEEDQRIARRLDRIPHEMRRTIFWVLRDASENSAIRPIWLALAIDYLSIATDPLIPEFLLSLEIARNLTPEGCEQVRRRLGEVFVDILTKTQSPADELVRDLGWLRKGATRELLARISGLTAEEFDLGWERMRSLSFVKQRPRDERFFLHDEMYDIIQRFMLVRTSEAKKERVFNNLNNYYEAEITKLGDEIDKLVIPLADSQAQIVSNLEVFSRLLRLRHTYYIEDIFYRLRQNARKGFYRYFYYSEEAVSNSDEELGALLRAEMRAFVTESDIHNLPDGIDGLRYVHIVADESIRWIEWLHSRGQNKEALVLAHALDQEYRAEIIAPAGPLAEAELNSWHGLMEAENANYAVAEDLLTQAITNLTERFSGQKNQRWAGTLARAYNNFGYLYTNLGRNHRSINAYREALPLWRTLKFTAEHANTLNNLGYALGMIGDYDAAQAHVRDGLGLREKQGLRPSVGLSLSTLAEVSIQAFASEIAIEQAERALTIFEWTEYPRGRGFALRTLAEAKRRVSGSPTSRQQKVSLRLLEEAETAALEAVEIFRTKVIEPIRLFWALTELGCIYREWYLWRTRTPNELTPKEQTGVLPKLTADALFDKSNAAFGEAAALAADRNLDGPRLDALISQFWLHYFRDGAQPGEESQTIRASIRAIFDTYYPNSNSAESKFYTDGIHQIYRDEILLRFGDWHTFLGKEAIDLYHKQGDTALCRAAKHFCFAFRCYAVYSNLPIRKRRTSRNLLYEAAKSFNPTEMRTLFDCVERVEDEYGISNSELRVFLVDQFGDQSKHFEFD